MTHEIILKMIEKADPNDTAAMDEIDKFVHLLITGKWPGDDNDESRTVSFEIDGVSFPIDYEETPKYSRSRDELKGIRPEKWYFELKEITSRNPSFMASLAKFVLPDDFDHIQSPHLNSETLAELHAIIQAIAYERENNDPAIL